MQHTLAWNWFVTNSSDGARVLLLRFAAGGLTLWTSPTPGRLPSSSWQQCHPAAAGKGAACGSMLLAVIQFFCLHIQTVLAEYDRDLTQQQGRMVMPCE
jgi:hypothetical protein